MRYTPYGRGNAKVTTNLSGYVLQQHNVDKVASSDLTAAAIGISYHHQQQQQIYQSDGDDSEFGKVKSEHRGPIKEHLKRHFTPLTTMTHHVAGSDGSCSPASTGSPAGCDTVTMKNVKPEFPGIEMQTNPGCCEMCIGCGNTIIDKYLLKVGQDCSWHINCLHCSACHGNMGSDSRCYVKEGRVYCKNCYMREFGVKCSACTQHIQSTDWVRRAKNYVFHLACFACDSCKRQLSTGEEFAMVDHRVVCKTHYSEMIHAAGGNGNEDDVLHHLNADGGEEKAPRTKRVRTTFSNDQVDILQANFNLDCNPDGQDLERIARTTGLTKRVTQVWFQNARARQKKHSVSTPTNQDKEGSRRETCIKCGIVYCMCRSSVQSSPGYHKGVTLVPTSSPPISSPLQQSITTQ